MSLSYRNRGKEHRTHKKLKDTVITIVKIKNLWEKNKTPLKKLKNRIALYSPIKIREKLPPPYSVLNPDTSSDSPSLKSKGERFVSAKHERTHTKISGNLQNLEKVPLNHPYFWKSYPFTKKNKNNNLKINTTS